MKTKRVRPVLVESKEITNLLINTLNSRLIFDVQNIIKKYAKYYELILISLENEKIEVGDTLLDSDLKTSFELFSPYEDGDIAVDKFYKVIARQSQISPELIQQLIAEYNNGGMKDFEIEMEQEKAVGYTEDRARIFYGKFQPKLTNNFVTIVEKDEVIGKPLDDYIKQKHNQDRCIGFIDGYQARKVEEPISYTEEEVKQLISLAWATASAYGENTNQADCNDWFNHNKKK